jgi:hypothetical protein
MCVARLMEVQSRASRSFISDASDLAESALNLMFPFHHLAASFVLLMLKRWSGRVHECNAIGTARSTSMELQLRDGGMRRIAKSNLLQAASFRSSRKRGEAARRVVSVVLTCVCCVDCVCAFQPELATAVLQMTHASWPFASYFASRSVTRAAGGAAAGPEVAFACCIIWRSCACLAAAESAAMVELWRERQPDIVSRRCCCCSCTDEGWSTAPSARAFENRSYTSITSSSAPEARSSVSC